jgi:hypothetical protein
MNEAASALRAHLESVWRGWFCVGVGTSLVVYYDGTNGEPPIPDVFQGYPVVKRETGGPMTLGGV